MLARLHLPRGTKFYEDALEGLVRVNEDIYRADPRLPSVYAAGVRYRGYDPNEDWRNAREVVTDKSGDCEDLASARAGELRARGEAGARVVIKRTGPQMTHAQVMRANGQIEDPSRVLGMGHERERIGGDTMPQYPGYDEIGAAASPVPLSSTALSYARRRRAIQVGPVALPRASRDEDPYQLDAPSTDNRPDPFERADDFALADDGQDDYGDVESNALWPIQRGEMDATGDGGNAYEGDGDWDGDEDDWEGMGADPSPTAEVQWVCNKTPTGWQGIVKVPLNLGRALVISRAGETKQAATSKAISAATNVLDNPLVKSLLPPQAAMALSVLRSPTAQKAAAVAFSAAKKLKFW